MSDRILQLSRIDFDNMENNTPERITNLAIFSQNPPISSLTAHGMAKEWIDKQPPVKLYLGWNGEIYPKFKLIPVTATFINTI